MDLIDFLVAYLKVSFVLNVAGWVTIIAIALLWCFLPDE